MTAETPVQTDFRFLNWSGSVHFTAARRVAPRDEAEVARLVQQVADRGGQIRPVGSGHSSTPVMATADSLVSLENLTGVVSHDRDAGLATVLPGTGLEDLGAQLAEAGLAMLNYGDVTYQAIAGALGTGTHGTGESLGNLSSALVGGRLVNGAGEVVPFGLDADEPEDSPLTHAAQVSLGALGILTSLTLRVRPAYQLQRCNVMTHIDWVLENFDHLAATYRHVDFYWYPRSDQAQVRILDEPGALEGLEVPGRPKRQAQGASYEVLPNHREIKFEEMEYMLPREIGLTAFREVRQRIKQRHRKNVAWRVLVRTIAADQAMLSNAQDRPTMTIALLNNATLDSTEYFQDMEPVLLGFGGRPHRGKKHTRTAEHLAPMYRQWGEFAQIREQMDPGGVFLNHHLSTVLGVQTPNAPVGGTA